MKFFKTSTTTSGIDVRSEIRGILYGDNINPAQGRPAVWRDFTTTKCPCWKSTAGSPDSRCGICNGEGYLYAERLVTIYIAFNYGTVISGAAPLQKQNYLSQLGMLDENRAIGWVEYDAVLNYSRYLDGSKKTNDRLYEIAVDDDGKMVQPLKRTQKWRIRSVTPMHGDNGRIEYFEIGLEKESA